NPQFENFTDFDTIRLPIMETAVTTESASEAIAESCPPETEKLVRTKVSIVIPVYNEEATVQKLIGLVVSAPLPPKCDREIICVNDCSKDGTGKKLDELPTRFPGVDFKIFHKPVNQG